MVLELQKRLDEKRGVDGGKILRDRLRRILGAIVDALGGDSS